MDNLPALDILRALAIVVLGATGTYMLLPHHLGLFRPRRAHVVGIAMVGVAVLLLATLWTPPGSALTSLFFYGFSAWAIIGSVLTITSRNPVYSALWFASVVLSTSGLFLLTGAAFLAAGTVIVYAGAIIVTFLFVIMLAQMEGRALYDRMARSPGRATFSCFLLFWSLIYALLLVRAPDEPAGEGLFFSPNVMEKRLVRNTRIVPLFNQPETAPMRKVLASSVRSETGALGVSDDPSRPHVAGLGGTLYTDHLIVVELVGALLFVALVGAVAIATPKAPIRPGTAQPSSPQA